jgi:hypothetical protein
LTVLPATALAGNVALAARSALALIAVVALAVLFALFGSAVLLAAVTVAMTLPLAGAVYDTEHARLLPLASVAADDAGTHAKVAPTGKPVMVQLASVASLGPALLQV